MASGPERSPTRSGRRSPAAIARLLLAAALAATGAAGAEAVGSADLTRTFASWDEWQRAYGEFESALDAFAGLAEEPIASAARLLAVMEARDRVYRLGLEVEGYIYLRLQLDGGDEEARSRQHLLDRTDRRWSTSGLPWFTRAITGLGRQKIAEFMAAEEALGRYAFFFRRFFDIVEHSYPEGEPELRALFGIFERQSARVYNALAISEASVLEVTLGSGERLEVDPARARTLAGVLPDAQDRRAVSRAWLEALGRRSQTYAALLEGIVRRQQLLAEVRGLDSALDVQLHVDAIPAPAVREVIRAAREAAGPLRHYHALRKRALGLDDYGLADRFIPLAEGGRRVGFAEARRLIVESTSMLGPEVQGLVERAFTDGWIDAAERPGKRAHGGSTFVRGQPYVLVSYRGSLEDVFKLTHEIGHAVHALLAHQVQPFVTSHRSSLTSEAVAAVFEGVLVEHLAAQAAGRDRVELLDLSIQNVARLFYRPLLDADFELRLYETEEPITGPSLGELYLAVVAEFYGESVSLNDWDRHAWQQVPHFYTSPLYLGRYGLAAAAAHALVARLTSEVDSEAAMARQALLELMRAGASDYPLALLRLAGADLTGPNAIAGLVGRLEALAAELEQALRPD